MKGKIYDKKRASYIHTNTDLTTCVRYNPDLADKLYKDNLKNKGAIAKVNYDEELKSFIEQKIIYDKFSPKAVLYEIQNKNMKFKVEIKSVNTIYRSIEKRFFTNLRITHLPQRRKKINQKRNFPKRISIGTSIEKRSKDILQRDKFGNWEMDCVIGQKENKKVLLVFTERKTRYEIIKLINAKSQTEVIARINEIEKELKEKFSEIFKTITVDNGSEFLNPNGIENSCLKKKKRTTVYYCHPYAAYERGSNEVNNKLIRRFLPKGTNFDEVLNDNIIKTIEKWMNSYPRKILGGKSTEFFFKKECEVIFSSG